MRYGRRDFVAMGLGCALSFSAAMASAENPTLTIGTATVVKSRVLKESRTVYIYLPASYSLSHGYRRYPVLYVRDGDKFFHSFTGAVEQLTSDLTPHAPEMIVVGIVESDRVRDSSPTHSLRGFTGKLDEDFRTSGGGESFLRFLERELVPYIDSRFSTSSYRIYCGYSFTGLSVIEELFKRDSIFKAFLMIDPSWWWDDYVMERRAGSALTGRLFDHVQLFMATTGESFPERYFMKARDVGSLAEVLRRTNPAGLDWKLERYADESHHSAALRALYDGLTYVFRGYKPLLSELYDDPEKLRARYEAISARLGAPFALPEGVLRFMGEQFLRKFKDPGKAALYLKMSTDAYPDSWAAWDILGEAYLRAGDKQQAARMYERSVLLNPQNENARKMLKALSADR